MAYAEAITAVSALVVGTPVQVRAIASSTGFVRVYDPALGVSGGTKASANLPTLLPTAQITQEQQNVLVNAGQATTVQNGPVKAIITPAAADTVNGSSVTAPVWLAPGDIVITATG